MISYIRKKYTEIWKNTILKTNTKIYDLGLYARSCDTLTVLTLLQNAISMSLGITHFSKSSNESFWQLWTTTCIPMKKKKNQHAADD